MPTPKNRVLSESEMAAFLVERDALQLELYSANFEICGRAENPGEVLQLIRDQVAWTRAYKFPGRET